MNKFELHSKATLLSESESAYQLSKRLVVAEEELEQQKTWNERLDQELQGKALEDDGVLADAYWHCVDLIEPYTSDSCSSTTLIRSVSESLSFLIEQWEAKGEVEKALQEAIWRLEDMLWGDDGQAWKEAEKALTKLKETLHKGGDYDQCKGHP